MNLFFAHCLCTALCLSEAPPQLAGSYLYQPAYKLDRELRGPAHPYCPQPGDLILGAGDKLTSVLGFALAGTWYPNHNAIVVSRPDGGLAALEAGLHGDLRKGIVIVDLTETLQTYEQAGRVWVRSRKTPLTPEQSARLCEFASNVEGRPVSFAKLYGQITPFRSRGPLRTAFMGHCNPDKKGFYCSELVVEACCYAGLIDADAARPNATYPRDIFFDHCTNMFVNRSLNDFACGWEPPARWTSCPKTETESSVVPVTKDPPPEK
ncbi:MAG TPA: hypothetical protein VGZ47_01260 [Gemmataceae bacterium]|jgi:hypothetical protein|nr:hypothetical protein [Gemmataceae bacterium]